MLGAMVAALAMTKINIALFVAAAMLLALLCSERENRPARAAAYLVAAVVFALPPILMRGSLATWGLPYCLIVEAAMVPVVALTLGGPVRIQAGAGSIPWFLGSLAACAGILVAMTLGLGTTPGGLWHGLVTQHIHFARAFNVPPLGLTRSPLAPALIGMLAGMAYASGLLRSSTLIRVLKVVYVVSSVLLGSWLLWKGGRILSYLLLYGLPWSWLVLAIEPGADGEGLPASMPMSRAVLGLATPFIFLMAYPVAGSQISYAALSFLIGVSVCGADVMRTLNPRSWPMRLGTVGVCALVLAVMGVAAYRTIRIYRASEPLGLPGASRVRLTAEDAATYRWLAGRLNADCETFVTLPGLNSLYFWARKEPPTALNTTTWMTLLSDAQQLEIIAALDRRARVMAVKDPQLVDFWMHGRPISASPLVRYIESMKPVGRRGEFELLMRPPVVSGAAAGISHRELVR